MFINKRKVDGLSKNNGIVGLGARFWIPSAIRADHGFALPSILFLITILTVVALSVISFVAVQHQLALRDIAKLKAEYAAQSGIAAMCAQSGGIVRSVGFDDGSRAQVTVTPWGMYQIVRSEGRFGKESSVRVALAGLRPSGEFRNALVFSNPNHELVLAGGCSITGDVVVGLAGVTTGKLRNIPAPSGVPITGRITQEPSPALPVVRTDQLRSETYNYPAPPNGTKSASVEFAKTPEGALRLGTIPDSMEYVYIAGNASFTDTVTRREQPLSIVVNGIDCGLSLFCQLKCLFLVCLAAASVNAVSEED